MVTNNLKLAMICMICFVGSPLLSANHASESSKQKTSASKEQGAEILAKQVSFIFTDVSLQDAMTSLSKQVSFPILLDLNGLDIADVSPEVKISAHICQRPLKDALTELIEPLKLTFLVKNNALLVTDMEDTGSQMVTKVYPVADLLPGFRPPRPAQSKDGEKSWAFDNTKFESAPGVVDALADIIRPDIVEMCPYGTAEGFAANSTLVITATSEAHENLEKTLKMMRKHRDLMLRLEVLKESK